MSHQGIIRIPPHSKALLHSTTRINLHVQVVKELIENSLDAEATLIAIEVDHATGGLMRCVVADNGHGITNWLEHIGLWNNISLRSVEENPSGDRIYVHGHRGTALYSIGQVTRGSNSALKIKTKLPSDKFASLWTVGKYESTLNNRCLFSDSQGTTIFVENIFQGSFPVRFKYLQSQGTKTVLEIEKLVRAYALARVDVRFRISFIKSGSNNTKAKTKEFATCPSGTTLVSVLNSFSRKPVHYLDEVSQTLGGGTCIRFILASQDCQYAMTLQLVVINGKPMKCTGAFYQQLKEISVSLGVGNSSWVASLQDVPASSLDITSWRNGEGAFDDQMFEKQILLVVSLLLKQLIFDQRPNDDSGFSSEKVWDNVSPLPSQLLEYKYATSAPHIPEQNSSPKPCSESSIFIAARSKFCLNSDPLAQEADLSGVGNNTVDTSVEATDPVFTKPRRIPLTRPNKSDATRTAIRKNPGRKQVQGKNQSMRGQSHVRSESVTLNRSSNRNQSGNRRPTPLTIRSAYKTPLPLKNATSNRTSDTSQRQKRYNGVATSIGPENTYTMASTQISGAADPVWLLNFELNAISQSAVREFQHHYETRLQRLMNYFDETCDPVHNLSAKLNTIMRGHSSYNISASVTIRGNCEAGILSSFESTKLRTHLGEGGLLCIDLVDDSPDQI